MTWHFGPERYELPDGDGQFDLFGMAIEDDTLSSIWNWAAIYPDQYPLTGVGPTFNVPSSDKSTQEMSPSTDRSPAADPDEGVSQSDEMALFGSKSSSNAQWRCDFTDCRKSFSHRHKLKYAPTHHIRPCYPN